MYITEDLLILKVLKRKIIHIQVSSVTDTLTYIFERADGLVTTIHIIVTMFDNMKENLYDCKEKYQAHRNQMNIIDRIYV